MHANALVLQGNWTQAATSLDHAQRCLRPEINPVAGVNLRYVRASLELARGDHAAALADLQEVEQLSRNLVTPHVLLPVVRACMLHALIRLGETEQVEQALTEMQADERGSTATRTAEAALRLTRADPRAARDVLAARARVDYARPGAHPVWEVAALVLEAITCDALDLPEHAAKALEQALSLAAPDHVLFPLLLHPAPSLLKRHNEQGTAHSALIREILTRIGAHDAAVPAATSLAPSAHLRDPLSGSEMRVLRYLPTNLSAPEIAAELSLSVNTVRTHMRHVYEKLGAHGRSEAVELARAHGLIAPATNYA